MIRLLLRTAALAATVLAACASAAGAQPIDASVGVTINALDGAHKTGSGEEARLTFAPLPLTEITLQHGADSLHLEGLPPVTIGYGGQPSLGELTTRLSIGNVAYRRSFAGGWFAGIGQTLYNQHTTYGAVNGAEYVRHGPPWTRYYPLAGSEEQYSRVTGMRLEAGRMWQHGATRIEAIAAGNPVMHGVQYTFVPTPPGWANMCSGNFRTRQPVCTGGNPTFADPEHAAQIDLTLRAAHRIGARGELVYGLRYLHYSARYEDEPGQLADRNVGIAPLLGYRIHL